MTVCELFWSYSMCNYQDPLNENIPKLALNGNCWVSGCYCLEFIGSGDICQTCHHEYRMHEGWRNGIPSDRDDDDDDFDF